MHHADPPGLIPTVTSLCIFVCIMVTTGITNNVTAFKGLARAKCALRYKLINFTDAANLKRDTQVTWRLDTSVEKMP